MDSTLIISIVSVAASLIASAVIPAVIHIFDTKHQWKIKKFETIELRMLETIEGYIKIVNQFILTEELSEDYYKCRSIINLYVSKECGKACDKLDEFIRMKDLYGVEKQFRVVEGMLDIPALKTLDCKPSKNGRVKNKGSKEKDNPKKNQAASSIVDKKN